jgi:hypothetical protein
MRACEHKCVYLRLLYFPFKRRHVSSQLGNLFRRYYLIRLFFNANKNCVLWPCEELQWLAVATPTPSQPRPRCLKCRSRRLKTTCLLSRVVYMTARRAVLGVRASLAVVRYLTKRVLDNDFSDFTRPDQYIRHIGEPSFRVSRHWLGY